MAYVSKCSDRNTIISLKKTVYKCLTKVNNSVEKIHKTNFFWYMFRNILREIHIFKKKTVDKCLKKKIYI